MTTIIARIRQSAIYCAWLEAGVIDSSNWVVGGSDSSVAVETNTARWAANQGRESASGIHLTHAKDFLRNKNTHKHKGDARLLYIALFFWIVGCIGVKVYLCACACVYACVPECVQSSCVCVCVYSACGGVFCRRCLRVVDVVVMGECALTHTRSREQGSACIKRANKRSFPHPQPRQDEQQTGIKHVTGGSVGGGCGGISGRIRNYMADTGTAGRRSAQLTWHLTLCGTSYNKASPPRSQVFLCSCLLMCFFFFLQKRMGFYGIICVSKKLSISLWSLSTSVSCHFPSFTRFHPFLFLSSPIFAFFSPSHYSATVCAPLYIYFILWPAFSLMPPPLQPFLPRSLVIQLL